MAGPDWIDLIRLLCEGFEIPILDRADEINKYSSFAIPFMDRDGRWQGLSREGNNCDCNESRFHSLVHDSSTIGLL
jgi:hypothetical protein